MRIYIKKKGILLLAGIEPATFAFLGGILGFRRSPMYKNDTLTTASQEKTV